MIEYENATPEQVVLTYLHELGYIRTPSLIIAEEIEQIALKWHMKLEKRIEKMPDNTYYIYEWFDQEYDF